MHPITEGRLGQRSLTPDTADGIARLPACAYCDLHSAVHTLSRIRSQYTQVRILERIRKYVYLQYTRERVWVTNHTRIAITAYRPAWLANKDAVAGPQTARRLRSPRNPLNAAPRQAKACGIAERAGRNAGQIRARRPGVSIPQHRSRIREGPDQGAGPRDNLRSPPRAGQVLRGPSHVGRAPRRGRCARYPPGGWR